MAESAAVKKLIDWMKAVVTFDVRSLAIFRIALGMVLLQNVCDLAPHVSAFFSDDGLLPRAARMQLNVEEQFTAPPYWCSLLMMSGESWFAGLLLAIAGVLAVCVVIGFRTRWMLLGSWVLLVSFQARNPLVLFGADDVLRCMLFWSIFLPLGDKWSIDRWRRPRQVPETVCSLASAALVVQLVCIYLFTALLKTYPEWRTHYTAVYYALATDHYTTRLGMELLRFPLLLKCLTVATLVWEFFGPLLLLYTGRFAWQVRTLVVVSFAMLHLGLATAMSIGYFPLVCIACWLVVLPGVFWNRLASAFQDRLPSFFNLQFAICNFQFAIPSRNSTSHPRHLSPNARGEKEKTAAGSSRYMINAVLGLLLVYVVLLNVTRLTPSIHVHLNPGPIRTLGDAAQLNQYWCMFAPRPYDFGGWFDIQGELADGTQVNLLHPDRPPQLARPELVSDEYPSMRWRKALLNLLERDCPAYRQALDEYLRRRWNAAHDDRHRVVACEAIYQKQPTLLPISNLGASPIHGPTEPKPLWRWNEPWPTLVGVDSK